jgi:hypothetical protein
MNGRPVLCSHRRAGLSRAVGGAMRKAAFAERTAEAGGREGLSTLGHQRGQPRFFRHALRLVRSLRRDEPQPPILNVLTPKFDHVLPLPHAAERLNASGVAAPHDRNFHGGWHAAHHSAWLFAFFTSIQSRDSPERYGAVRRFAPSGMHARKRWRRAGR